MLVIFLTVMAACVIAVIYPYLGYPLILAGLPKKSIRRGRADAGDGGKFSLLFCAYNEATSLPSKLENIKKLKEKHPLLEVLAFDDGSSDGTADIIEGEAGFVRLVRGGGRNGKAHGMKLLAAAAGGEYLVFTDANVLLDINAFDHLAACFADKNVGGVCGALRYLGADSSSTAAVGGLYWRLEEKIKDFESATGSVMGADGSIFSIRRELYPEFPDTVLDDFTVSMEVVFRGLRLIKSNDVIAYEKLVSARSDEFSRKVRIAARAYHTHATLAPKRAGLAAFDKFKYGSHKTIRWFGGAFLMLGCVAALLAAFLIDPLLCVILATVLVAVVTLGLRSASGLLSSLTEIVLAMVATVIGVGRAARGQTFAVWNPAKSR